MVAKDVRFSAGARARLLRGINILADAVKVTLGPRGRNVLVGRPFGAPRITKDGVSVAREIELADHFENMGAQMVREVATRTSSEAGDGTTTATILAQAILCEGEKAVAAGMNSIDLKRGIDVAVGAVVAALRKASRPVTTNDEVAQVAMISANGEREVGDILARAMSAVGREGVITVEEAKGTATELDVVEGLTFDRGYISPYFVTDAQTMEAVLDDAFVLLCEQKLANLQPLLPLLEAIVRSDKPLLVVAEDVEGEALATLVVNRLRGGLRVAAVKAPGFGDRRRAMLDDIAAVTGGQVVSTDLGTKLESVTIAALGRARQIRVDKDATTIIDGAGDRSAVEDRCAQIRRQIAETTSDYDRETLQERLGKLVGGVAVIRVGGATETEVKERRDRIEDAIHATRAAVEEGILPGGGAALVYATPALATLRPANQEQQVGIAIVRRALQAPLRQIAANAGVDGSVVIGRLLDRGDPNWGYDAQAEAYGDMFALGIVDPTKVVRIALQDAASVAGLLITTEVMVADRPAEDGTAAAADAEADAMDD